MTTIEKLQADMLYNEQHPLFAPYNDDVMGERFAGRYECLGEDEEGVYKRWYFDNGHNYTLVENTNMLYACEPIPEDYFIHKHIEKCIYDIVTSHSDVEMPEIVCTENEVLSMRNPVVLIRTIIDRENRNVAITNIHVQREHWYNGYGKQLKKDIYTVCENLGFRLLLTEIMPTFYRQMVRRGAKVVEVENIVEITNETNLSYSN